MRKKGESGAVESGLTFSVSTTTTTVKDRIGDLTDFRDSLKDCKLALLTAVEAARAFFLLIG